MVVKKEFAVLFRRKKLSDTVEEFIPYKVIEGSFQRMDNWFMDQDEIVYPHIAEPMVSGVGYGERKEVEREEAYFTEENIELIKQDMLETALNFSYTRDRKNKYYIIIIDKQNGEDYPFEDEDTPRLYKQYDDQDGPYFQEEYIPQITLTPLEIKQKVCETIKGQDDAVKKIVTAIWTTYRFKNISKKNMLVMGPTGVGKTAIFRKLQKILGIPLTIFSVPGLSQAGYVGRSVDEILLQIYYDNGKNLSKAENAIVILDEIDKLAYGTTNTGDISTSGVQNELLKLIEGCKRTVSAGQEEGNFVIDTTNMLFIGTGAFSELYEEKKTIGFGSESSGKKQEKSITERLINYGMKRELIGRLPVFVELHAMTKEILIDIIINSDESEFLKTVDALKELGIEVSNIDELIDMIAEDAIKKGIGARGLINTVNNIFEEIFYTIANSEGEYCQVVINKNILSDNSDFELVPKNTKIRTKKREMTHI